MFALIVILLATIATCMQQIMGYFYPEYPVQLIIVIAIFMIWCVIKFNKKLDKKNE